MAAKAKPSDVLVSRHNDICYILSVSKTTLESLTGKLFQMQIVDRLTKIAIMSQGGYAGADALLDYVEMRVDNKPTILQSVFEAMQENESLEEIVQQIKAKWDNESKQFLSAGIKIYTVSRSPGNRTSIIILPCSSGNDQIR